MPKQTQQAKPPSRLKRMWRALALAVAWFGLLIDHAKPIRVSLLVLSIGGTVALAVDQAAELLLNTVWIDPNNTPYVALVVCSGLAGVAIWYTGRQSYRLVYPRWPSLQNPHAAWLRLWLPRVLGAAVPLLVALGYEVAQKAVTHGICSVQSLCGQRVWRSTGLWLEAFVLFALFTWRRYGINALHRRFATPSILSSPHDEPRAVHMQQLGSRAIAVFLIVLILNVIATVLVVWQPGLLDGIGPLAITLIAGSFFCMSGGFLCMLADRWGLPLLSLLVALAIGLHALHMNDNHHVRQYASMKTYQRPTTAPTDHRPSFDDYANAWLDSRCTPQRTCPIIVVSSEGGGIRSAAWTALVLNTLSKKVEANSPDVSRNRKLDDPLFAHYLFAGSGVSGGSLGLATYVVLLQTSTQSDLEPPIRQLLRHDFLAPMLANMFFVDFTQRWLPFAWFDDRSRALTRAWEQAAKLQSVPQFAKPFSALYEKSNGSVDASLPALFLNSTTVDQGWRFVQQPFKAFSNPPWTAAYDGSAWIDPRMPLSEAVLNSARFTYLSPAGTLLVSPHPGAALPIPLTLQLVDGGYFENSGATTLYEVMQRLKSIAAKRNQPVHFIVLHVSNDPTLTDFVDVHDQAHPLPLYSALCPKPATSATPTPSGEVTAPIKALLNTRDARGEYARAQLLAQLHLDDVHPANGDVLWHFRLCPGDYPLPLGWAISAPVFDEMDRQLQQNYPLQSMAKWLNTELSDAKQ